MIVKLIKLNDYPFTRSDLDLFVMGELGLRRWPSFKLGIQIESAVSPDKLFF